MYTQYSTSYDTWTTRCTHNIVQVMSHGLLGVHKYSTSNVTWTTRCTHNIVQVLSHGLLDVHTI